MVDLQQLENNKFEEGTGYPKSTVRTLITNDATQPIPVELDGDNTTKLAFDASGNLQYVGNAIAGSATSASLWKIQKLTYDASGNLTDRQWADAVTTYTKVWDARSSYTYS